MVRIVDAGWYLSDEEGTFVAITGQPAAPTFGTSVQVIGRQSEGR